MDVSVVIVTYNTADWIGPCLESLLDDGTEKEVFVVDNASADDTAAIIRTRFPGRVRLIENEENRGFAAAKTRRCPIAGGGTFCS